MSDAELAAIIHAPLVEVYALVRGRATKACSIWIFARPANARSSFFGVTAKLVGSGAGRWLMNRALELAWSRPVARVWVHTCTQDHPGAVAFYQRSGFRAFRRQIEIAGRSAA